MVDYALIALSPSWKGPKFDQNEISKAVMLYQYLSSLKIKVGDEEVPRFEVNFLTPEGWNVPFSTGTSDRDNIIGALNYIAGETTENSNVICYFSGHHDQASRRVPTFLQQLYDILTWELEPNEELFKKIALKFNRRFRNFFGKSLNHIEFKEYITSNYPGSKVVVDLWKVIGVLEDIKEMKEESIPGFEEMVELYNKPEITKKIKIDFHKHLEHLIDIQEKERSLDVMIDTDKLIEFLDVISEMENIYPIDISKLIVYLKYLYVRLLYGKKVAWIQVGEKFDELKDLLFTFELNQELFKMKSDNIVIVGSGIRSGIIAEHLFRKNRICISSMKYGRDADIDHFNFANGLVRASYENLKKYNKYTDGNDLDIFRAYQLELTRLARINALDEQSPQVLYETKKPVPKKIPRQDVEDTIVIFDPSQDAFIYRPILPEGLLKPPKLPEEP